MRKIISIVMLLGLVSCAHLPQGEQSYPKTPDEQEQERVGRLTGDEGIVLLGGQMKSSSPDSINVNTYLWRATLDTVYFMPLLSADPFGGAVMTDWYRINESSKERFKLNVYVIGADLRSDAVKVSAFTQHLDSKGNWSEGRNNATLAHEIEEKILLKAREIKYKHGR